MELELDMTFPISEILSDLIRAIRPPIPRVIKVILYSSSCMLRMSRHRPPRRCPESGSYPADTAQVNAGSGWMGWRRGGINCSQSVMRLKRVRAENVSTTIQPGIYGILSYLVHCCMTSSEKKTPDDALWWKV